MRQPQKELFKYFISITFLFLISIIGFYLHFQHSLNSETYNALKKAIDIDYQIRLNALGYQKSDIINRNIKVKQSIIHTSNTNYRIIYKDSIYNTQADQYTNQIFMADILPIDPNKILSIFQEHLPLQEKYPSGIIYRYKSNKQYSANDSITPKQARYCTPIKYIDAFNNISIQGWVNYDMLAVFFYFPLYVRGILYLEFFILMGLSIACIIIRKKKQLIAHFSFVFNDDNKSVIIDGIPCTNMFKREIQILRMMVENENNIVTRQELINTFWPNDLNAATKIDTHLSTLRKKLLDFPKYKIETLKKEGYKLVICKPSSTK